MLYSEQFIKSQLLFFCWNVTWQYLKNINTSNVRCSAVGFPSSQCSHLSSLKGVFQWLTYLLYASIIMHFTKKKWIIFLELQRMVYLIRTWARIHLPNACLFIVITFQIQCTWPLAVLNDTVTRNCLSYCTVSTVPGNATFLELRNQQY